MALKAFKIQVQTLGIPSVLAVQVIYLSQYRIYSNNYSIINSRGQTQALLTIYEVFVNISKRLIRFNLYTFL